MGAIARRQFLVGAGAMLAAPFALGQSGKAQRVILVRTQSTERVPGIQGFLDAMRSLGYVSGKNLVFEDMIARKDASDLLAVVDRAIARKPEVIIAWESIAQVVRSRTTTIPIVLTGALDPVRAGLARSLSRPGLNVTGFAQLNDRLPEKHMEILREILPRLRKVGQLVDRTASGCQIIEAHATTAAHRIGCTLISYYVSNQAEIEQAFAQMAKDPPDALLPCPSSVLYSYRDLLFEHVLRLRIPLTSYIVSNVPRGVLFAYAANLDDLYRGSAVFVDKILRGAQPGDLPIEQPMNFQLVVNLGTAKALGLAVPESMLLRANRVIG
jgi:putative ABC transport system substrate-binding protein